MQAEIRSKNVNQNSNVKIGSLPPLLEIRGPLAKIDLSAWISGVSYMLGVNIIGTKNLFTAFHEAPFDLVAVISCLVLFFVSVAAFQKYMGLSLLANEYGKPRQLAIHGPYRFSRNPIYVAFLLPLISFTFISPLAACGAIVFYVLCMNFTVLRAEERDLVGIFGETYVNYAKNTPRWLF